jgi:hypothetical protein
MTHYTLPLRALLPFSTLAVARAALRRLALLCLVLVAALEGGAAADPMFWSSFRGRDETLRRPGRKTIPKYDAASIVYCLGVDEVYERDRGQVTAEEIRVTRSVCMRYTQMYFQVCIDAYDPDACSRIAVDGPALAKGIAALGPLSADEQAMLARIPTAFWLVLRDRYSGRTAAAAAYDIGAAIGMCIKAAAELGTRPRPEAPFLEIARDLCVGAAKAHAKDCLGVSPQLKCSDHWDHWEQIRDAARTLGPLDAAQEAAFARILDSPELANLREQRVFDRIVDERANKQIDTCTMIAKLRERMGPPAEGKSSDPGVPQRWERTPPPQHETPDDARRRRYTWEADQTYINARRGLDHAVEDISHARADEIVTELSCIQDYKDAAKLLPAARALAVDVAAHQAAEAACRAKPSCQAERKAEEICRSVDLRRTTKQDIDKEMRYAREAGVVDLGRLNDYKQALEQLDTDIATARDEYRALAGKSFAGACKPPRKPWRKRMPIPPMAQY